MNTINASSSTDVLAALGRPSRLEPLRYLMASIAALALDSTVLWAGIRFAGLAPWLAGAWGYAAGLGLIYLLSVTWVFRHRAVKAHGHEFLLFAVLGLVGLGVNSVVLYGATAVGLAVPLAKGIAAGTGFVINFVTRRAILFTVA